MHREFKQAVAAIVESLELPPLQKNGRYFGLCSLISGMAPDSNTYMTIKNMVGVAAYYDGLGEYGEWTKHRLNLLAWIDTLTEEEFLEALNSPQPKASQDPSTGTQATS